MSVFDPPEHFVSAAGCLYERIDVGGSFACRLWVEWHAQEQWQMFANQPHKHQFILVWCKAKYSRTAKHKFSYRVVKLIDHLRHYGFQTIKKSCPYAIYQKLL